MLGNGLALAALGKLGEVLAGAEDFAGAGDDDCTNGRVELCVVHDVFHGLGSCAVEGVSNLGTVDADDQKAILAKVGYNRIGAKVICHCFLLESLLIG